MELLFFLIQEVFGSWRNERGIDFVVANQVV